MSTTLLDTVTHWTASELRSLPAEQRDAILVEAARRADPDYTHNAELTEFEAFGEEDPILQLLEPSGRPVNVLDNPEPISELF